ALRTVAQHGDLPSLHQPEISFIVVIHSRHQKSFHVLVFELGSGREPWLLVSDRVTATSDGDEPGPHEFTSPMRLQLSEQSVEPARTTHGLKHDRFRAKIDDIGAVGSRHVE